MWIGRQDLVYAIRSGRRAPLLCVIAIVALALGLGLNAGVFTLLNAIFLTPPTEADPSRFVQAYPRYEGWFTGGGQYSAFTTADFDELRANARTLDDLAAWRTNGTFLEEANRSIPTLQVTCNYFHVFGNDRPLIGRFLSPGECTRGTTAQVAVLSEPFWRNQFDSNPQIVGTTIHLNGVPFTVIGVVPSTVANYTAGGIYVPYTDEILLNRSATNPIASPNTPWLGVAGRLRPSSTRADAQAEFTTLLRRQDRALLARGVTQFDRKSSVVLTNGSFIDVPAYRDQVVGLMALILGPLALVLLLACSNVTMLFLSRAVVRRGEIAVRLALGVGRTRLLVLLALEAFLMATVAGALSIALAWRVPQMLMNAINPNLAVLVPMMHPDWRVFGYLGVLVGVTTFASSLAPMHAAWKMDLVTALKGRESAATMRSRLTGGLIVAQIAMTFVLIAAAVLFARMPGMVTNMDPGFETRQTLSVPLTLDMSPEKRVSVQSFYRALEDRIRSIPGVQSLAYESLDPFRQYPPSAIRLLQQPKGQGEPATIDAVSTDFFSTFGIRMMAGRPFSSPDSTSTNAVISQAFARQFWPGEDPIGKTIITPDEKRYSVVGVAADTRSERFGVLDGPRLYVPRDPGAEDGKLYVRFVGSASTMERAIHDTVKSLDNAQALTPQTIWEQLEAQADNVRSLARIVLVMASIAVVLAISGVYGVLSFVVNQRRREYGVRMVLGANRAAIFQQILLRGSRQIVVGLAIGVVLAEPAMWAFARLIRNSPFPFRSFDPPVLGIAAVLLAIVAFAAMYLPALRATQVDPIKSLRVE